MIVADVDDNTDKATTSGEPKTERLLLDLDQARVSAAKAAGAFLKGANGP
jgi:hypothetical protein